MIWERHKGRGILGAGNILFLAWVLVVWLVKLNVYVSFLYVYFALKLPIPFLEFYWLKISKTEAPICEVLNKSWVQVF